MKVCWRGLCILFLLLGRVASAEVITGVTIKDCSSQLVGIDSYDRAAAYLVDGSGLVDDKHGTAADGTMWETIGDLWPNEGTDTIPVHVTFDLGANYDLSKIHVWNYNEVHAWAGSMTARGADKVLIYVSSTDDVADLALLDLDAFRFAQADGTADDPGFDVDLNGVDNPGLLKNVRLVRFDIQSTHADWQWQDLAGLSEVRFYGTPGGGVEVVPEPSSLVMLSSLALGLFVYRGSRRIARQG